MKPSFFSKRSLLGDEGRDEKEFELGLRSIVMADSVSSFGRHGNDRRWKVGSKRFRQMSWNDDEVEMTSKTSAVTFEAATKLVERIFSYRFFPPIFCSPRPRS